MKLVEMGNAIGTPALQDCGRLRISAISIP